VVRFDASVFGRLCFSSDGLLLCFDSSPREWELGEGGEGKVTLDWDTEYGRWHYLLIDFQCLDDRYGRDSNSYPVPSVS
jgi:hypothetical protein